MLQREARDHQLISDKGGFEKKKCYLWSLDPCPHLGQSIIHAAPSLSGTEGEHDDLRNL